MMTGSVQPRNAVSNAMWLADLEREIEEGFAAVYAAWQRVGYALASIRDQRLYTCDTFAEYVEQRWHIRRSTAYEWIAAATVVRNFGHADPPQRIGVALALADLPADQQEQTLEDAREQNGGREPPLAVVRLVIRQQTNKESEPPTDRQDAMVRHLWRVYNQLDDAHKEQFYAQLHRAVEPWDYDSPEDIT